MNPDNEDGAATALSPISGVAPAVPHAHERAQPSSPALAPPEPQLRGPAAAWRRDGWQARAVVIALGCALAGVAATLLQLGADSTESAAVAARDDGLDPLRNAAAAAATREGYAVAAERAVVLIPQDAASPGEAAVFAALIEATPEGAPAPDLLRVTVERAPGAKPIRVGPVFNLTRSRDAAERIEAHSQGIAAVSVWLGAQCTALLAVDFNGEPEALLEGWPELDRYKNQVSNWQETGQRAGITRHRLLWRRPPTALHVQTSDAAPQTFDVALGPDQPPRWRVAVAPKSAEAPRVELLHPDAAAPVAVAPIKGRPGHLGWFVDTVRDISWVGPRKIAAAEHLAFEVLDILKRSREAVFGPGEPEAPELAASDTDAASPAARAALDPNALWAVVGERLPARVWPPEAAKPLLEPPGPGEGAWVPMTRLVKPAHDGVPYFYQSWLRPDKGRAFARISVTAWDPSRVHLGFVAGTREPMGTTGLKGTGLIPRRPGLLPSVVAAFNGGFQTKHGAYGMVVEDQLLLPPVGGGATVANTEDGRVLLGTWPKTGPEPKPGRLPQGAKLPEPVSSLRQNLQPLVDAGVINPTGRAKWGGTAGIGTDATHTTRTGICLMRGGALAYFYGNSVDADAVGRAMLAYGCDYGVHLDMNAGHSGFEFYNIKDDEAQDFEASRMIKKMGHMKYPRYVQRDVRDYFYLTLRPQTAARLQAATGQPWQRPTPTGAAPTPPQLPPARVLTLDLALGAHTASVVRLPPSGVAGRTERVLTQPEANATPQTPDGTVALLYALAPASPDTHLSLAAETFGALLDSPGAPGLSLPVVALAREGAPAQPVPSLTPAGRSEDAQRVLIVARTPDDLFLATAPTPAAPALRDWLIARGATALAATPIADATRVALAFADPSGERAIPHDTPTVGADRVVLTLPPATTRTGRVESLFPTPAPTTPTP